MAQTIQRVEPSASRCTPNQSNSHYSSQDSGYNSNSPTIGSCSSGNHLIGQISNHQFSSGQTSVLQASSSAVRNRDSSDWRSNDALQNLETDEAPCDLYEIPESQTTSTRNTWLVQPQNSPGEHNSELRGQDSGYITSENTSSSNYIDNIKCIIQQYNTTESRLTTFINFPSDSPISVRDLAEAGLYYVGPGDKVKCAYCLGKLYNWEEGDKPLEEHSKHFRNCPFVKHKIHEKNKKIVPHSHTRHIRTVESVEIKQVIDIVKRLGYEEDIIKSVISVLQKKGIEKLSSTLVLDAIFTIEENSSSDNVTNFSKNTSKNSSESDVIDASLVPCNDNRSQPMLACAQLCEVENKDTNNETNHGHTNNSHLKFISTDKEHVALAAASPATDHLSKPNASSKFCENDKVTSIKTNRGHTNDIKYKSMSEDPVESSASSPATDRLSKQDTTLNKQVNSTSPQFHSLLNSADPNVQKLSQELKNLKQTSLCNKCFKNKSDMLFLPCRHKVACEKCSADIDDCIKCSKKIVATVKVFMI